LPRVRKYNDRQIRQILGEQPRAMLDAVGLKCAAVRTLVPDPERVQKTNLPPKVDALVCRVYPATDLARLRFIEAKAQAAETTYVFRDPDDDLEIAMIRGFHQCVLDARQVIERQDTATDAAGNPAHLTA
jgi:hypothetical protein